VHLQLAPVRADQLGERLLIAAPGTLQCRLLRESSMPFRAACPGAVPFGVTAVSARSDPQRSDQEGHRLTQSTSPALATALAYHHAWTSYDLDKAMSYITGDIICDAPGARISGAQQYRDFLGGFMSQLTGVQTAAAFGDHTTAVLFYYPHTAATSDAPPRSASPWPTGRSPVACSSLTGHRSPRRSPERGRSRPGQGEHRPDSQKPEGRAMTALGNNARLFAQLSLVSKQVPCNRIRS
jgi:hypothetical protein